MNAPPSLALSYRSGSSAARAAGVSKLRELEYSVKSGRVVASDVSHFYENMESGRPFTTAFHVGQMLEGLEGFDRLFALAPFQLPGRNGCCLSVSRPIPIG
jgi:hypothetical protein